MTSLVTYRPPRTRSELDAAFADFLRVDVANGDASADTVHNYRNEVEMWAAWCIAQGFDPATITTMHASNIYDQLFAWDKDLQPKPQMVGDFNVSADSLLYTFTLRPGLKFHDGSAVTTKA